MPRAVRSARRPATVGRGLVRLGWLALLLTAAWPARAQVDTATWTLQVLEAINAVRAGHGLSPLQPAAELTHIASAHSERMAAHGRLTHDAFQSRMDATGSDLCVENLSAGTTRAAVLVQAWSRAPSHRRNLLEPRVRRAGIAQVRGFVTWFACE